MTPATRSALEWLEWFPFGTSRPVDSLAASLFVRSNVPGARTMVFFTAFFDASGNGVEQPFIVVSGYVANYTQWKNFEEMWQRAHEHCEVTPPFHMADFMAATENPLYKLQKNARADYVELAKNPSRADEFLKLLLFAQASNVHCGISCIVPMDTYEDVSSLLDLREVIPPYALGARMCINNLHRWEEFMQVEQPAEYIFEEGDFEQGKFTNLMIDEGQAVPIYRKKSDFAGLQGADHYAWEQYNCLRRRIQGKDDLRRSFKGLLQAIPKVHTQATREVLINLCHAKNIDPRTGVRK
jgi:hypothetical protein